MIFKNVDRSITPVIEAQQKSHGSLETKSAHTSKLKPKTLISKPKELKNEDQTWRYCKFYFHMDTLQFEEHSGESATSKADESISLEEYLVEDARSSIYKKSSKVEGSSSRAIPPSQPSVESAVKKTKKKGLNCYIFGQGWVAYLKRAGKNGEDEIVIPYVKPKKQISPYIGESSGIIA